jgi:hypothetical protein
MIQRFRYAVHWLIGISIKIRINFYSAVVFKCCDKTDYARIQYRLTMQTFWPLYGSKSFMTSWYFSFGLWMSGVLCHVLISLSFCQINLIRNLTRHFFKVDCNTVISSTVVVPKLSLPKKFSDCNAHRISNVHTRITHFAHFILNILVSCRIQFAIQARIRNQW